MRAISRSARNDDRTRGPLNRNGARNGAGSRYEVLERVGEGTLFVVYKVRDRENNRVSALKALKGTFAKNPAFTAALKEAAGRTASLFHPHLAQLEEVGEEEGTLFLVSEWLPGNSLEARLRRAPFSHTQALSFTRQIAEALAYLHRNGEVHGDLRPRQVLSAADGSLKLTEAGLARAFPLTGLEITDVQQDAAYYLAPESGGMTSPTPASDLYSLGVILYRMLTGRVPFDGPSPLSIANRHRRDTPMRPSQWNPTCPVELEELTLRLLAKNPAARYASADELLAEIGGPAVVDAASVDAASVDAAVPVAAPQPIAPVSSQPAPVIAPAGEDEDMLGADVPPVRPSQRLTPQVQPRQDTAPAVDEIIDEKLGRKKQRRREAIGAVLAIFWLFVALGLFAGIIYGGYHMWTEQTPQTVSVPNYRGKSRAAAEQLLAREGLKLVVGSEVYDPKRPVDTVIKGDPPPGKEVRAGREILVTVSKGEEPVKMPDLTELDLKRARQIIERSGMRLGQISDQYHDTVPKGYIIAQYPEPGQPFRRSEPISLTVSRGLQPAAKSDTDNSLPPLDEGTPPPTGDPGTDDTGGGVAPITNSVTPPDVPLISRSITIRVAIPADGQAQEVSIDVQDEQGERTVYRKTHNPGDLVVEKVHVTRQQGTKATVRVYVDGTLFKEQVI